MRCPRCVAENTPSTLTASQGSTTTCMGGPDPYWDWEGNFHVHDPNSSTRQYWCSNGHVWFVTEWPKCAHCDYHADREDTWREVLR